MPNGKTRVYVYTSIITAIISIKKIVKISGKVIGIILLIFFILFLILSLPRVQTKLGKYATDWLNNDFKTSITIGKVGLQLNGDVELKAILIKDYKQDTLISIGALNTSIISITNLYNNKLNFGDIDIRDLIFNLKTYKGEQATNLDIFVAKFDDNNHKKKASTFLLSSSDVSIDNGIFRLIDNNRETPKVFEFNALKINTTDFLINGPDVSTRINTFSFNDSRGVAVKKLTTNFKYTRTHMNFDDLNIVTKASELKGDLNFNYKREDLKDFTDKVEVNASFRDSKISLTELNAFFNEFGRHQTAKLNTDLTGTLNNLTASNLNISTTRHTKINGVIIFKNLFSNKADSFALEGRFKNLASNYNDLTALLPKLLGNSIPSVVSKVGNFKINGLAFITAKHIDADMEINTDLGYIKSDLKLTNIDAIDNASYSGNIVFNTFDIGKLLNDPLIKNTSLNLDVEGKGFTAENLKTKIKGDINSIHYNGYTYKDIVALGNLGNKIFNGTLKVNDPNAKLNFKGLADLSNVTKKFNFKANVDYANLRALNFVTRDRISEFRGVITTVAEGSTYDNAIGELHVKNAHYKNQDRKYNFEDFDIVSLFKNEERIITINSPDIIEGEISGKFKYKDVLRLAKNSLGSIYTNYTPNTVEQNQYLNFKFNIYSKIAAVLYKDLLLGKHTFIKGRIETDEKGFDLTFNSPEIKFQDYFARNVNLSIDNNNPLYNTYIEIDSLSTGMYNTSDFTLVNVTKRDTLFIKSEFRGGKNNTDNFNINLFYTIEDLSNKSVIGFRKSKIRFKNYDWLVNSQKDSLNKIRFDRKFETLDILPIKINQDNEEIMLSGKISDALNRAINLTFNNVHLLKITPRIDSLAFKGVVNGGVDIIQNKGVYLPKLDIKVSNLAINNYTLGNLRAKAEGNNSILDYVVDVSLINNDVENLLAKGRLNVSKDNPFIDIGVNFDTFLLDPLNPLGEGVINNIRGLVSGNAKVKGDLNRPSIDGELLLNQAGLSIPYLNVDYSFDYNSKVILEAQKFNFNAVTLTDSQFSSKGNLNGFIAHNNFSDWKLGLNLTTNRLLVLNTKASQDKLYYGTAFVSGNATINGPTNQLSINVEGTTASGTEFNIPLNDTERFGDNSFIHFLNPEEKAIRATNDIVQQTEIKGLELNFDLNVTQDATIEIVIDKEAGSTIKGKGDGNLDFLINTNGAFNMFGNFTVAEGIYNFKYRGIVEKKFEVERGGTIVWEGDPMKAQINLKALYKTSANPSILLDTPISQRIPVEVEIMLTEQLEKPTPSFNLNFPSVTSTLKSELDYRLSSKSEKDFQALTLLGTGGFSSASRGVNFTGTISERLRGIVNTILGNDNGNVNFGLDFELAQDTPDLQTNNRVGFTLETKINEKILVNGKLGVPFGNASQTVISGDVQIDLLLNGDGTLRAKVFNRENSIRNFGEEIGYTQGVGLSYNVEFDSFKEFLQIIFSGKNKKAIKEDDKKDKYRTGNFPEYISTKKTKN